MPIVVYHHKEDDVYEIVDGFHRYSIMLLYPDIYKREKGLLPCSIIEKPISQRMASTIRHNRARGSHNVDLMSNIVAELVELGKNDKWLSKHLGMSPDEILRLKQVTGLVSLFKDQEFSETWEVEFV
jgi:ParB-like chromosome segregation protein Spo0J